MTTWWDGKEVTPGMKLNEECMVTSRKTHKLSNSLVLAKLVVLFTDRKLYGRAIAHFYPVFHALEDSLIASSHDPDVKKVLPMLVDTGLLRTKGLEQDLEFYLGPSWRQQVPKARAVLAYVQHIKQLEKDHPSLLLAHAYTQHTAMASGGQMMKRMARRQMGLPEGRGTGLFDMPDPAGLKAKFIAAFNEVGRTLSPETRAQMVAEHLQAFAFNNRIMRDFQVGWATFFLGLWRMMPPLTRISLLMLLVALVTLAWAKYFRA